MYRTHSTRGEGETHGYQNVAVIPTPERGGKRRGKSMKRKPRTFSRRHVTLDNLKAGRDNGGYYDVTLKCVVYNRKADNA